MVLWVIAGLFIAALVYGPALWVRSVMGKYSKERSDLGGTGGDLARYLLDKAGLQEVKTEVTEIGDHYDPREKAVRLTDQNFNGRSLTAITVAAHEVGHALQDRDAYGPLKNREVWVRSSAWVERVGPLVIMAAPLFTAFSKSLSVGAITLLAGMAILGGRIGVHAMTLPTEFDASFNRALPILDQGDLIPKEDLQPARRILLAAALTYVAGAIASLLDVVRWLRYLR